jgi:hypothetical protein
MAAYLIADVDVTDAEAQPSTDGDADPKRLRTS